LLVQLDVEDYVYTDKQGHKHRILGASYADVRDWVTRWRQRTDGYPVILYTGGWYWRGSRVGDQNGAALGVPLWNSHYVFVKEGKKYVPAVGPFRDVWKKVPQRWWTPGYGRWPTATILQYSSAATVPGINGGCDVNYYRGSVEELRAIVTGKDDDMPLTDADAEKIATATWYRDSDPGTDKEPAWIALHNARRDAAKALQEITKLRTELETFAGRDPVDEMEIVKGVLAGLSPSAIADAVLEALPAERATETADALNKKIAAGAPPPD
jgi:GH25 family lysozyme M1 (1,4-beta-N-acetylmuramidase)